MLPQRAFSCLFGVAHAENRQRLRMLCTLQVGGRPAAVAAVAFFECAMQQPRTGKRTSVACYSIPAEGLTTRFGDSVLTTPVPPPRKHTAVEREGFAGRRLDAVGRSEQLRDKSEYENYAEHLPMASGPEVRLAEPTGGSEPARKRSRDALKALPWPCRSNCTGSRAMSASVAGSHLGPKVEGRKMCVTSARRGLQRPYSAPRPTLCTSGKF